MGNTGQVSSCCGAVIGVSQRCMNCFHECFGVPSIPQIHMFYCKSCGATQFGRDCDKMVLPSVLVVIGVQESQYQYDVLNTRKS